MDIWKAIETERMRLADDLDTLSSRDWQRATCCEEWNVKQLVSHLVLPFEVAKPRFALRLIRNRRNGARTIQQLTVELAAKRTAAELVTSLRANADSRWKPPGTGPVVPLTEIVVHSQDIRHALGLTGAIAQATIDLVASGSDDGAVWADYSSRIAAALPAERSHDGSPS